VSGFEFDPFDAATRRDPFAAYAEGRRAHPVHTHTNLPFRIHSVFGYDDTQSILRDPEAWSSVFNFAEEARMRRKPSMLGTDPPEHTRLRGLVGKAFTPRIVGRLEPRMREIAGELVQRAVGAGEVDLVEALTYPLPVAIIAEIIGIPTQHRERFKQWSDRLVADLGQIFAGGEDAERIERQQALLGEMHEYLTPLAEARRSDPRDDLLTGLVRAEHEGSKLDYDEMLSMIVLILVAGNETTTTLIGNTVLELLAHPEAERRVREDASLLPTLIDEVLRFSSPVQFDPRRCTRDTELRGVPVRKDEFVLCWLGSANRDEKVFENADRFDVARSPNPHVAFGFGPHYCLGANLARLEAQVAVGALLEQTSGFDRAGDGELPLHPSPVFRAVTSLPLHLRG
jgi:cytochrome P450